MRMRMRQLSTYRQISGLSILRLHGNTSPIHISVTNSTYIVRITISGPYPEMSAKILLVEDEPAIQELLAFNITQAGFLALRAEDEASAWRQIRQNSPDLILLDWMLPNTSGLLLAKQFRSDASTRDIPIIMLTARSEEHDKILGLESGADDYITKPFSPRELMARIRAMLRRHTPAIPEEPIAMGGLELSPVSHRVRADGINIELGPTEFRLLYFS